MMHYKKQQGFTLIELIMSIALMGIIAGIFISTIIEGARTYVFITSQNEASFTARFALKRMMIESRNASRITAADTTSLAFTNTYSEDIQLSLSGSVISISDDGGANTYPLIENANSLTITYYDNQNNALATPVGNPDEVHSISFELETTKNGIPFPVKGKIYLRTKPK